MKFKLADLICGQYNSQQDSCIELGREISNNFIESAGTKIFSEKERALIELPVNCIDAYRTKLTYWFIWYGLLFSFYLPR